MKKVGLIIRVVLKNQYHDHEPKVKITTRAGIVIMKHVGQKLGVHYTTAEAKWIWSQHHDGMKKNLLLVYLWDKVIELLKLIIRLRFG